MILYSRANDEFMVREKLMAPIRDAMTSLFAERKSIRIEIAIKEV